MRMKSWNLPRLAKVAEVGASIGVMISVVYLAIQIHGSNEQLRAQAYNDTLDKLDRPLELLTQNQSLAELMVRAEKDPGSLSEGDWERYCDLQLLRFNGYEHAYHAHIDGTLKDELWKGIDYIVANRVKGKAFQQFWLKYGGSYAEPFHGYIETRLRG
jgi:hypothetical protein